MRRFIPIVGFAIPKAYCEGDGDAIQACRVSGKTIYHLISKRLRK
jgi:hypothetical protein